MEKLDLKSMEINELEEYIVSLGDKKFRAKQIYTWLHQRLVTNFDEMTDISKVLREKLSNNTKLIVLKPVKELTSKLDGTKKFLFELDDGNVIESVFMRYKHGNSVCVSSQVGCRMGCRFCASTLDGLTRNLTASEILEQIYRITVITGEKISNVVVMGSGEPFDNYDNILKFIRILNSDMGLNISARNITVSTCGLVDKINELAKEKLQITLAISLHAPNDTIRKSMMPIANKYSIAQIMEACNNYYQNTGRRISFEYSLVQDVNDSKDNAIELAGLIKNMNCHVNLIPVNPIKERDYKETQPQFVKHFKNMLEKNGINVTIRREMGRDIQGACGQLRKSYKEEHS